MTDEQGGRGIRVRSIGDNRKAFQAYDELRRSGRVENAVVLANLKDGSLSVLGQGMGLDDMAQTVLHAAHGLTEAAKRHPEALRGDAPRSAPDPEPATQKAPATYTGEPGGLMNTAWRSFAERVMPPDAPEVQRVEMRRAFYAGGQFLLGGILKFLDPGEDPTEADMEHMNRLQAELDAFGKAVQRGEA